MSLSTVKSWFKSSPEEPFKAVFVDLKKAANGEIHCVEKPLEDDLYYVAISYRWGELEETVVDTKVGYTAIIKSFHLDDFYQLCRMITKEIDLQYMDYVWVDAICVDQTNYERRKATIYQMSNIYQRAKYILAVPDLHAAHLKTTSTINKSIMEGSAKYQTDLYSLLHQRWGFLDRHVATLLNQWNVPDDYDVRKVVESYIKTFTTDLDLDAEQILEKALGEFYDNQILDKDQKKGDDVLIKRQYFGHEWKKNIQERRTAMDQSMAFLEDLIKDWSSRVWVISEFSIAKERDNFKYWFTQLAPDMKNNHLGCGEMRFYFFKLWPLQTSTTLNPAYYNQCQRLQWSFNSTLFAQIQKQSMFHMLLKSKASRHEDRFYAILPLTKYHEKIKDKAMVNSWKIDTLIAVKLKLYELMDTYDKFKFLFFSGSTKSISSGTLPSFASSTLNWDDYKNYYVWSGENRYKYDRWEIRRNIGNYFKDSFIMLGQNKTSGLSYLNFCPRGCYVDEKYVPSKDDTTITFQQNEALLALYSKDPCNVNALVRIPNFFFVYIINEDPYTINEEVQNADYPAYAHKHIDFIYLIGNFEKNMWVLTHCPEISDEHDWKYSIIDQDSEGFNIY